MEHKLDSFLNLLTKASNTKDNKELSNIEEQLQKISLTIQEDIKKNDQDQNKSDLKSKIDSLGKIIDTLDKSKKLKSDTFKEFKQFIDKRKFK